ncbi:MAG TPA: hypothetical protein VHF69_06085 [Candidatus Synoicihabitans sp.]|nr:hypothetical protein [Candidatus Synoicihabitans sp.]
MNPSYSTHPRFTCRLMRTGAALFGRGDGRGLPPIVRSHVAGCGDCQSYFTALESLDRQLIRSAQRPTPPVPIGLEERLFAAVEPTLRSANRKRGTRRSYGWAAAAVGAVGVVLLVAVLRAPSSREGDLTSGEVSAMDAQQDAAAALAALETVGERLRGAFAPAASTLAQPNPLRAELAAVQADTRSAWRFLATSFLPTVSGGDQRREDAAMGPS